MLVTVRVLMPSTPAASSKEKSSLYGEATASFPSPLCRLACCAEGATGDSRLLVLTGRFCRFDLAFIFSSAGFSFVWYSQESRPDIEDSAHPALVISARP